jgi:hypothetical protein
MKIQNGTHQFSVLFETEDDPQADTIRRNLQQWRSAKSARARAKVRKEHERTLNNMRRMGAHFIGRGLEVALG